MLFLIPQSRQLADYQQERRLIAIFRDSNSFRTIRDLKQTKSCDDRATQWGAARPYRQQYSPTLEQHKTSKRSAVCEANETAETIGFLAFAPQFRYPAARCCNSKALRQLSAAAEY